MRLVDNALKYHLNMIPTPTVVDTRIGFPRYGTIYETNLDLNVGSTAGNSGQAVVVSRDEGNQFSATVTVLPIEEASGKIYPYEVGILQAIPGLKPNSRIQANCIRTVDKSRLARFIGVLPLDYLTQITTALTIHLDLK